MAGDIFGWGICGDGIFLGEVGCTKFGESCWISLGVRRC